MLVSCLTQVSQQKAILGCQAVSAFLLVKIMVHGLKMKFFFQCKKCGDIFQESLFSIQFQSFSLGGVYLQFLVFQVLKTEYPKGVDIIYESVGGDMFSLCLNALATYGRLIVIGMISQVSFLEALCPSCCFVLSFC